MEDNESQAGERIQARGKAKINHMVLDWNQGHQYELIVFSIYTDRQRNTDVCMCGLVYTHLFSQLCSLRRLRSNYTPVATSTLCP